MVFVLPSPIQVLIIAHIPPGDSDNVADYGKFYLNMTKQFSDVIVGHFFGHTHRDQFQLVMDESVGHIELCVINKLHRFRMKMVFMVLPW